MDLSEQFGVGFVAVTQSFDTAESTGRLILNVLLPFARFEREIASDRLGDKFGAMRQRGLFVGGKPPRRQPSEQEVVDQRKRKRKSSAGCFDDI